MSGEHNTTKYYPFSKANNGLCVRQLFLEAFHAATAHLDRSAVRLR
jgi:hypothetical protein